MDLRFAWTEFPKAALESRNVTGTWIALMLETLRRELRAVAEAASEHTPAPGIAAGYSIESSVVGNRIRVSTINTNRIWPFYDNDTRPHNIPGAWGRPSPFGESGRFGGFFHPGTKGKHAVPAAWSKELPGIEGALDTACGRWLSVLGRDV